MTTSESTNPGCTSNVAATRSERANGCSIAGNHRPIFHHLRRSNTYVLECLAVVYGAFVALFPERTLEYLTRIVLVGYENPEELEPSEWYV
ncbi:MAG: hypothetical protein RI560_07820 [Natronomonas sp.]|nr:hypothetical protein [Natronomonas sp.]